MRIVRMPLSAPGAARVAELVARWRSLRGVCRTFRRVLHLPWRVPPHRDVRGRLAKALNCSYLDVVAAPLCCSLLPS